MLFNGPSIGQCWRGCGSSVGRCTWSRIVASVHTGFFGLWFVVMIGVGLDPSLFQFVHIHWRRGGLSLDLRSRGRGRGGALLLLDGHVFHSGDIRSFRIGQNARLRHFEQHTVARFPLGLVSRLKLDRLGRCAGFPTSVDLGYLTFSRCTQVKRLIIAHMTMLMMGRMRWMDSTGWVPGGLTGAPGPKNTGGGQGLSYAGH